MNKKNQSAKKAGKALAYIQFTFDDLLSFGFKKLKETGNKKSDTKNPVTVKERGVVVLKKTAGFLGEMGESFYENYEELKAKKVARRK